MKETPILFSEPMVQSILAGRKTQTRRIVKPQPEWSAPTKLTNESWTWKGRRLFDNGEEFGLRDVLSKRCKYGRKADRLWVKEAFSPSPDGIAYRATNPELNGGVWKPSIFMPRKASRITLEITGVRVEQLHEIKESDAKAEGCKPVRVGLLDFRAAGTASSESYVEGYGALWESINGPGSWSANPWVWVISFKRL